jgi:hypothetical protein
LMTDLSAVCCSLSYYLVLSTLFIRYVLGLSYLWLFLEITGRTPS